MADRPPPLSPAAASLVRAYEEASAMPEDARARVATRLRETPASRPPVWLWAGVGALAAGLLLWGLVSVPAAMRASETPPTNDQAAMQASETEGDTAARQAEPTPTRRPAVRPRPQPRPQVVPEHAVLPEPAPDVEPVPDVAPEPLPAPPHRPRTRPKPSAPPPAPDPTPATRLGEENRLIAQTWEHVRAKRYAKASATLREHAATFPEGVLSPERRALEVIVACLMAPGSAAGKADAYANSGHTTLLSKVRAACSEEKSAPQ